MIIENIENDQTTQIDERILNLLDYIILMLSQANTVDEVDLIMDDFMSEDIMVLMDTNRDLFSILSVVWLDTFERVCMREGENNFSVKVLFLPMMFRSLGWNIEDKERLNTLHQSALKNSENTNTLCPVLILLFIEGLTLSPDQALSNFENKAKSLSESDEDDSKINSLLCDIMSLGWGH